MNPSHLITSQSQIISTYKHTSQFHHSKQIKNHHNTKSLSTTSAENPHFIFHKLLSRVTHKKSSIMALESCLRVSTPRPHCLPPLFSSSREKLVFSTQKVGFKKSVLNSTVSIPSGVAYRKSRFVCNAREAVNEVQVVNDSSWDELVIGSETPVLVDFWAPWCGPCRMIAPIIDELAKEYAGKITCYKLNTDESPNTATKYGIRSIPTVLFFKNGEKKDSVIGAVPKATLSEKVEKYI